MTAKELIEQLKRINQERMTASLHDDTFFMDSPDIDALDKVIILINHLSNKKLSDKVTVAELWEVAEIDS